jgi:hypothetical protein
LNYWNRVLHRDYSTEYEKFVTRVFEQIQNPQHIPILAVIESKVQIQRYIMEIPSLLTENELSNLKSVPDRAEEMRVLRELRLKTIDFLVSNQIEGSGLLLDDYDSLYTNKQLVDCVTTSKFFDFIYQLFGVAKQVFDFNLIATSENKLFKNILFWAIERYPQVNFGCAWGASGA